MDMKLTLDHVPFAYRDLDAAMGAFDQVGLSPQYGGAHDNGCTHMAIVTFDDRSYIELIAERRSGDHQYWPEMIHANAGPATWCIRVSDIVAECRRVLARGYPVDGPRSGGRTREDGVAIEWQTAKIGSEHDGYILPFLIEDCTPLSYRVTPSASMSGSNLTGIGRVVIAVESIDATTAVFQDLYRWPTPVRARIDGYGEIATFPGTAVSLASADDGWLAERVDDLGPCPCSVLISTADLEAASAELRLEAPVDWPAASVAFVDDPDLGRHIGVMEPDHPTSDERAEPNPGRD